MANCCTSVSLWANSYGERGWGERRRERKVGERRRKRKVGERRQRKRRGRRHKQNEQVRGERGVGSNKKQPPNTYAKRENYISEDKKEKVGRRLNSGTAA